MNLSIILAIAFAAISGAPSAPARGSFAPVIAAVSTERRAVAVNHVILSREDGEGSPRLRSYAPLRMTWVPLTGAATPRAPAVTC